MPLLSNNKLTYLTSIEKAYRIEWEGNAEDNPKVQSDQSNRVSNL